MQQRIWDRFLTEQDKKLAALQTPKEFGFGESPALLLIDLYRSAYGDKPEPLFESIKSWSGSCGMTGWNALPSTVRILNLAREVGMPVIHITHSITGEDGVESWNERGRKHSMYDTDQARPGDRAIFEIINELKPLPGEVFIRKSSPSAFWGTYLVAYLISKKIDTLIVVGESTSGCVRASVVDGRTHGYRMIVVEDCVFDRTEASHAINLFDMNQKYADVVSLDYAFEQVRAWQARKGNALKQPIFQTR